MALGAGHPGRSALNGSGEADDESQWSATFPVSTRCSARTSVQSAQGRSLPAGEAHFTISVQRRPAGVTQCDATHTL